VEADLLLPGLEVEVTEMPALPKMFDLSLTVYEHRGALRFDLTFYADRYRPEAMKALLDQVAHVLVATSTDPERAITDYDLGDPGPVDDTDDPTWSPDALSRSVQVVAARDAGRTAVTAAGGQWTYGDLDQVADRVAAGLTGPSAETGPVVVVRRDGGALAAALVGCARAGRTCVVVPSDQVAFYQSAAVLDPDELDRRDGSGIGHAGADAADGPPGPAGADATRGWGLTAEDRAGVLGVPARHLGVALMAALRAGAEVHLDLGPLEDPASVVARIRQAGVTALFVTGPVLRMLLPFLASEPGLALTQVVVDQAGDLIAHDVEDLRRAQPGVRWVSTYAPSPLGRPLAVWPAPQGWSAAEAALRVPLGSTVGGRPLELRNVARRPAATGELGEVVGAEGRGDRGWRRPDGIVELAGSEPTRTDPSTGGVRSDPLDVVGALRDRPEVADALVSEYVDPDGNVAGIAWVACPEHPVDLGQLRQHLLTRLPETRVPSEIVILPRLPLTPEGGYDLGRLPEPVGDRVVTDTYRAPRTAVEKQLVAVFEDLTGADRVGIDDTFFELHGFSLLATQLVSRIRQDFGVVLPLRQIFEAQTVEGLAALVLRAQIDSLDADDLTGLLDQLT